LQISQVLSGSVQRYLSRCLRDESLFKVEGGLEEKMGGLQVFLVECGGFEMSKGGLGGVLLNESKKLSFAIFWYYV